jgi:hypothetical protein
LPIVQYGILATCLKLRVPLICLRVIRKEAAIRRMKKHAAEIATTMVVFE